MTFEAFLTLLVIAVVVAGILHYGLKFYIKPGGWSFITKVIIAYFGAYWGTGWFGRWFDGVAVSGIYIIPAVLGAAALLILVVDVAKTLFNR